MKIDKMVAPKCKKCGSDKTVVKDICRSLKSPIGTTKVTLIKELIVYCDTCKSCFEHEVKHIGIMGDWY